MKEKVKSSAHERRTVCYPPIKYHTLLIGYARFNEAKQSEATTEIIKHFFDNLPEQQRQRCLNEGIKVRKDKHHY